MEYREKKSVITQSFNFSVLGHKLFFNMDTQKNSERALKSAQEQEDQ